MSADTRPRDALVEAAVSTAYTRQFGHGRWEAASEETRQTWREQGAWFVPGVVMFMAEWLSAHEWACCRDQALTGQWRKEMGDAK